MQTVFIVEPDAMLLQTYANSLAEPDRQIYTFRTAHLAARALEKIIPDILILELALPGHNGFELLYEISSYNDTKNIKVIVNSFINERDLPWGFVNKQDLGIVHYIHKADASIKNINKAIYDIKKN